MKSNRQPLLDRTQNFNNQNNIKNQTVIGPPIITKPPALPIRQVPKCAENIRVLQTTCAAPLIPVVHHIVPVSQGQRLNQTQSLLLQNLSFSDASISSSTNLCSQLSSRSNTSSSYHRGRGLDTISLLFCDLIFRGNYFCPCVLAYYCLSSTLMLCTPINLL